MTESVLSIMHGNIGAKEKGIYLHRVVSIIFSPLQVKL